MVRSLLPSIGAPGPLLLPERLGAPCPQASSVLVAVTEAWQCVGLKDLLSGRMGKGSLVYGDGACSLPHQGSSPRICPVYPETYGGPIWVNQNHHHPQASIHSYIFPVCTYPQTLGILTFLGYLLPTNSTDTLEP